MSETTKSKSVVLELSIPVRGYRKWLRATHYAIQRLPEFVVARFVLQPEGLVLDDCVVVLTNERIKHQEKDFLKFLQRAGVPTGPAPRCHAALRPGETFNVGWMSAVHGIESEICFCGISPNGISQITKSATSKDRVDVDPLVSVSCSVELMKHFLADIFSGQ